MYLYNTTTADLGLTLAPSLGIPSPFFYVFGLVILVGLLNVIFQK